jgi:hypothetical protein
LWRAPHLLTVDRLVSSFSSFTPPDSGAAPLQCCVCVKLPHGAQLRAAARVVAMHPPVRCSTVVRNGGSGSQAPSSHVCGCVTSKLLSPRYQHAHLCPPLLSRTPARPLRFTFLGAEPASLSCGSQHTHTYCMWFQLKGVQQLNVYTGPLAAALLGHLTVEPPCACSCSVLTDRSPLL